jgi:hypothetical protein
MDEHNQTPSSSDSTTKTWVLSMAPLLTQRSLACGTYTKDTIDTHAESADVSSGLEACPETPSCLSLLNS